MGSPVLIPSDPKDPMSGQPPPSAPNDPPPRGPGLWLGVDMGGTATRWATVTAGADTPGRGTAPGATGLVFDVDTAAAFTAALAACASGAGGRLAGAVLGVTGAGTQPETGLRGLAAAALGVPPGRVRIVNDMVLAWHAAFPDGHGHLVLAGTGSAGISLDHAGQATLVGGRGTLIDDAGSGAWIVLRALDALWRRIDAHGRPAGAETLAEHLFAAIGGDDWDVTRRVVYSGYPANRGTIAGLAPSVAAAAEAGDPVARAILAQAGCELARLAQALAARCGPAPVRVTGGVLALHPVIVESLRAALPPDTDLALANPDPALTGAGMARAAFPIEDDP